MQQLTSLYHSKRGLNNIPRKQQQHVFCFDEVYRFTDGCVHITIKTNKKYSVYDLLHYLYTLFFGYIYG